MKPIRISSDRCNFETAAGTLITPLLIRRTGVPGAKEPKEPVAIDQSQTDECGRMRSFDTAVRGGGTCHPSLIDGACAVAVDNL